MPCSVASTSYTYDKMGRTLQQDKTIGGGSFSMPWAYNVGGLATSYSLPNGTTISQTFDNLGRPTSITSDWVDADHPATLAGNFSYHPLGYLSAVEYGNGTVSTRDYASNGMLKSLKHGTASNPGEFLDLEYHRDEGIANNGLITQIIDHNDPSKTQTYSYDGFNRLLTAETSGSHWGLSWTYDRYGNRIAQSVEKGTAPSTSLSITSTTNRVQGWSYDPAGNVLSDGQHSYLYNAENRMTTLDSGSASYSYDAQGKRVIKDVAGEITYYFFDIAEYRPSQGWERIWISRQGEKLAEYADGTTRFYHTNHLKTPVGMSSLAGGLASVWEHFPYGEEWLSTGSGEGDEHRFTGHLRDVESETDHSGARHYASAAGRWLSVDPVVQLETPQLMNRFAYVGNDPINYVDRDGRFRARYEHPEPPPIHEIPSEAERGTGGGGAFGPGPGRGSTQDQLRNPFPRFGGGDLNRVNNALQDARDRYKNKNCNEFVRNLIAGAGTSDADALQALVGIFDDQLQSFDANQEIFNGRRSDYEINGQRVRDILRASRNDLAGLTTEISAGVWRIFLGARFFDADVQGQRGANLLHEIFHTMGAGFGDSNMVEVLRNMDGFTYNDQESESRNLQRAFEEQCPP